MRTLTSCVTLLFLILCAVSALAVEATISSQVGVGVFQDVLGPDARFKFENDRPFHRLYDSTPVAIGTEVRNGRWVGSASFEKEFLAAPRYKQEGLEDGRTGFTGTFDASNYELDLGARYRIGQAFSVGGGAALFHVRNEQRYHGCCSEPYISGTIKRVEQYRYVAPTISVGFGVSRGAIRIVMLGDAYPWLRRRDDIKYDLIGITDMNQRVAVAHGQGLRFQASVLARVAHRTDVGLVYQLRKTWISDGARAINWDQERFHNTNDGWFSLVIAFHL